MKHRKITALFLSLVMAVSLCGCAGSGSSGGGASVGSVPPAGATREEEKPISTEPEPEPTEPPEEYYDPSQGGEVLRPEKNSDGTYTYVIFSRDYIWRTEGRAPNIVNHYDGGLEYALHEYTCHVNVWDYIRGGSFYADKMMYDLGYEYDQQRASGNDSSYAWKIDDDEYNHSIELFETLNRYNMGESIANGIWHMANVLDGNGMSAEDYFAQTKQTQLSAYYVDSPLLYDVVSDYSKNSIEEKSPLQTIIILACIADDPTNWKGSMEGHFIVLTDDEKTIEDAAEEAKTIGQYADQRG